MLVAVVYVRFGIKLCWTSMVNRKLSASALSTFLQSPKKYYWANVARLEPIQPSVQTYDHDKLCGILWAEFVDRFYKGVPESENLTKTLTDWHDRTDGWVPPRTQENLTNALTAWGSQYYQNFNPMDGCRTPEQSEMFVENDRFVGYLDGLSEDRIIHEVKTTSRAPQLSEQMWKVEHSIQVRLYAVLANANGYRIEFAWKNQPHQVFRGPVTLVTPEQRHQWEMELNALADSIYALGADPSHFPCNPDSCCLVTRGTVSMCQYQTLCDLGLNDVTKIGFKPRHPR